MTQMAALMSPGLAGTWREQIAVQADDRLQVGAGARELKNIAAAKTEADRSLALEIAYLALGAFAAQGIERGGNALAAFGRVGAQCRWQADAASGGPAGTLPPPYMSATKATYLLPAIVCSALDGVARSRRASSAPSAAAAAAR